MAKVFYSRSNHNDMSTCFFDKLCQKLQEKDIKIIDTDSNSSSILLDKILNSIYECDLFICDITPDYILDENNPLPNPNVMIELGYALSKLDESQIIILLNDTTKLRPSMIQGMYYLGYDHKSDDSLESVLDEIIKKREHLQEYCSNKGWITKKYTLSDKFLNTLDNVLDIIRTMCEIKINNKSREAVILCFCNNGHPRVLNIITRKLSLKKHDICLSNFSELDNELKHLELVAYNDWFE